MVPTSRGDLIVLTDEMERNWLNIAKTWRFIFDLEAHGESCLSMLMNGVVGIFNNVRKSDGKDWLKSFCNRYNFLFEIREKRSVKVSNGFHRSASDMVL
ncbi:hypothetical protein AVEN_144013-1 [Araneus ventricosus]|uniref:Uncharacterized protein n=1 Tax=Araneus ventricosus TaxID=182803 RepID=A0A4Y2QZ91_ARAVE|nr:hypothetical protein AVEN_144013-1 [Araneus ventricosus]